MGASLIIKRSSLSVDTTSQPQEQRLRHWGRLDIYKLSSVQKGERTFWYDVSVQLKWGNSQLVPQKTNKNFEKEEGKYHSDAKCDSVMVEVKTSGSAFHVRISTRSKGNIQKNAQKDPHTTYTMARDCNSDTHQAALCI